MGLLVCTSQLSRFDAEVVSTAKTRGTRELRSAALVVASRRQAQLYNNIANGLLMASVALLASTLVLRNKCWQRQPVLLGGGLPSPSRRSQSSRRLFTFLGLCFAVGLVSVWFAADGTVAVLPVLVGSVIDGVAVPALAHWRIDGLGKGVLDQ
jgi:hypothetical protein